MPVEANADLIGAVREQLQEAADQGLGDYLSYRVGEPKQELTNAPKGGHATRARRSWSAMA